MASPEPAAVRFVPLGGLGEIGMNCLGLEQGDDLLVIDCGTSFPSEDIGVDVMIPDFSYLLERKAILRGVFLTHGHDDHIGALPFLLRQMRVPVWGPPHALALVKRRMEDQGMKPNGFDLRPTTPRSTYDVGSFVVEPVRVSHSIIEATALKVETAAGTVVHSGDFKFDAEPPDGEPTDEARLEEIGRAGVGLLLSDSTNVDSAEPTSSEQVVGVSLERLIKNASGRVFVVLFASNVQRLLLIGAIARATRRKICLLGRSLVNHIEVALEIGRLDWPSDLRVSPEEARTMRPGEVLVLAGGSQGERQSAMARLAAGMHQELSLEPGDTVIFSSRVIPGNDRAVLRVMNDVIRRGAQLHTYRTDPGVHTSGHASRPEQARMLELIAPRCFVPIHGTLQHMMRHAALARELGIEQTLVVENGTSFVFDGERVRSDRAVQAGAVSVGFGGEAIDPEVLRQRSDLARYGLVLVTLVLDGRGRLVCPPQVVARGVSGCESGNGMRAVAVEVARTVEQAGRRRGGNGDLREDVRRAVRRQLERDAGCRPVIEVCITSADG